MPDENARDRNSRIGTIGADARHSQATNAAASSNPTTSAVSTSELSQPAALPRSRPQTTANAEAATSARPGISRAAIGPKLSRSRVITMTTAISPIGRLIQKIHCHPRPSVMAPPTAGPASTAIPTTPLKMPSARARSSLGKAVLSNAMPSGITNAAPAPCARSEEHTSELQSRLHLVCRLLLEKKKKQTYPFLKLNKKKKKKTTL